MLPVGWLLIFGIGLSLLVLLVVSIVTILRRRSWNQLGVHLPPLICALALFDATSNPLGLSCEAFRSPVVEQACYEGTVNFATVKLRENAQFEIQSVGPFAFSQYHAGTWRREADTLRLRYDGPRPQRLSETYAVAFDSLNRDSVWVPVTLEGERGPTFYEGYCKGEN